MKGVKHDQGKDQWHLLPLSVLHGIVKVMTYGATKYSPDGWKTVEDGEKRYYSAFKRHFYAHHCGEWLDEESGLPHIFHAATDILMWCWFCNQRKKGK